MQIRTVHIFLHTLIKSLELGYQILLAFYIIVVSAEYLKTKAEVDLKEVMDCEKKYCMKDITVYLGGLVLFMWFHIMHQNLCSNCRLAARQKTVVCCICWEPLNMLICKFRGCDFVQKRLCRDKCITPHTVAKAILMPLLAIGFRM